MYFGDNPEEVFKKYTEDIYSWQAINPFNRKMQKSQSVDLFVPTCMAVKTEQRHTIELQVISKYTNLDKLHFLKY